MGSFSLNEVYLWRNKFVKFKLIFIAPSQLMRHDRYSAGPYILIKANIVTLQKQELVMDPNEFWTRNSFNYKYLIVLYWVESIGK